MTESNFNLALILGDTNLILGQQLAKWCGHGPILEEDIAMSNIALDLLGQANFFLEYAAEIEGKGRTADDLAFIRKEREFCNFLLAERPNGDFAVTTMRHYLSSVFFYHVYDQLLNHSDETIAGIAGKAIKEVTYHKRHTGDWIIRLGDGTDESHTKTQAALNELWNYTNEFFEADTALNSILDLPALSEAWKLEVTDLLSEAKLKVDTAVWMYSGGTKGLHSEYLGFILAEMQYLQRAYPNSEW